MNANGFVVGTLVHTKSGLKPIEQLKIGDEVLSKLGTNEGVLISKTVTKICVYENQEIWTISYRQSNQECVVAGTADIEYCVPIVKEGWPSIESPYNKWVSVFDLFNESSQAESSGDFMGGYALITHNRQYIDCCAANPIVISKTPFIGVMLNGDTFKEFGGKGVLFSEQGLKLEAFVSLDLDDEELGDDDAQNQFKPANQVTDYGDGVKAFQQKVYQIEVADTHTFFVGEHGLWVHDSCVESPDIKIPLFTAQQAIAPIKLKMQTPTASINQVSSSSQTSNVQLEQPTSIITTILNGILNLFGSRESSEQHTNKTSPKSANQQITQAKVLNASVMTQPTQASVPEKALNPEWDDKEFVINKVRKSAHYLQYASERLKDDEEVVLETIKNDGHNIRYASPRLRDHKELALIAIKSNKSAGPFYWLSDRLKDDKDVVMTSMESSGCLEHISERLKDDKDVVLTYIKNIKGQVIDCLKYVSERLRDDDDVINLVFKRNESCLKLASLRVRDDKAFMLKVVKKFSCNLSFASERLQDDEDVVLTAAKGYVGSFKYASERLRKDRSFILRVVKYDREVIRYIPEELRADREFIIKMAKENGRILQETYWSNETHSSCYFVSEHLLKDDEVLFAGIATHGGLIRLASEALKNNREFVLMAVRNDGSALKYAPAIFQNDREIVLEAIKSCGGALSYANPHFMQDRELIILALGDRKGAHRSLKLDILPEKFRDDDEIVLAKLKTFPDELVHASSRLKDNEHFVLKVIQMYPRQTKEIREHISPRLRAVLKEKNPIEKLEAIIHDKLRK